MLLHRLAGGETRKLYGKVGSRHTIKQAVKAIKDAARKFGDEEFQAIVQRAMTREAATVAKRKAAVGKR